ncbi:uncharacterized protein METZ01_LOCUS165116, partial [marine metagenome]
PRSRSGPCGIRGLLGPSRHLHKIFYLL